MSIVVDASTPALTGSGASQVSSVTSDSFSPPGSSLIVLALNNPTGTAAVTSITDSLGSHLTYTKLKAINNSFGSAEIWVADVPSSAPGSMTITVNWASATYCLTLTAIVLTGAASAASQTGATASNNGTSSTPTCSLTATRAGSFVLGAISDWSNSTAPTIPAGQSDSFNSHTMFYASPNGFGAWVQGPTSSPSSGATSTVNDTGPTCNWAMVEVEIVTPPPALTGTASDSSTTSDSVSRTLGTARTASETSATSDAPSRLATSTRSPSDTTSSSDAITRAQARTASDTTTSTDSVRVAHTTRDTSLTTDTAAGSRTVLPAGIAATGAVGRPTIWKYGHVLQPVGIARGGGVGVPTLTQVARQTIRPQGWQETGGVGAPTVTQPGATTIVPVGIPPS